MSGRFVSICFFTVVIVIAIVWGWHQIAPDGYAWLEAERVARQKDILLGGLIVFAAYELFGKPIAK